jgi:hypothetical protein
MIGGLMGAVLFSFVVLWGLNAEFVLTVVVAIFYVIFSIYRSIEAARQAQLEALAKKQKPKHNDDDEDGMYNFVKDQFEGDSDEMSRIETNRLAEESSNIPIYTTHPSERKKKRKFRHQQPTITYENEIDTTKERTRSHGRDKGQDKSTRGSLSRSLPQQGQGTRFEAVPGTLDASQIVAPAINPNVNPTLESMTGIYDNNSPSIESNITEQTINIHNILTSPDGIRNSIILAEILTHPKY